MYTGSKNYFPIVGQNTVLSLPKHAKRLFGNGITTKYFNQI